MLGDLLGGCCHYPRERMTGTRTEAVAVGRLGWEQSRLPKIPIQMAVPWQAPFGKMKNEHETELDYGSPEWKHQQGAGQLPSSDCDSPAYKGAGISKRTMPLCYGTAVCPLGRAALSQGCWPGRATDQSSSTRELVFLKQKAAGNSHKGI